MTDNQLLQIIADNSDLMAERVEVLLWVAGWIAGMIFLRIAVLRSSI